MFLKKTEFEAILGRLTSIEEEVHSLRQPEPKAEESNKATDLKRFKWYDFQTVIKKAGQFYTPTKTEYMYDHIGRVTITLLETGTIRLTVTYGGSVNVKWSFYDTPEEGRLVKPNRAMRALDPYDQYLYRHTEAYIESLCREEK